MFVAYARPNFTMQDLLDRSFSNFLHAMWKRFKNALRQMFCPLSVGAALF
jgi:hypothetical protein